MDGYIKYHDSPTQELKIVKMWGLCLRVTNLVHPSSIPVRCLFSVPVLEICVGKQRDIKFLILAEDSDTRGSSSLKVRMEYLFALQL